MQLINYGTIVGPKFLFSPGPKVTDPYTCFRLCIFFRSAYKNSYLIMSSRHAIFICLCQCILCIKKLVIGQNHQMKSSKHWVHEADLTTANASNQFERKSHSVQSADSKTSSLKCFFFPQFLTPQFLNNTQWFSVPVPCNRAFLP